jgi:hypothetical protein
VRPALDDVECELYARDRGVQVPPVLRLDSFSVR